MPLHAGLAFGAIVAGVLSLWVDHGPAECFLAMMLTLAGSLAAVTRRT